MIILKTKEEIEIMNEANRIVHRVLDGVASHISDGRTTRELDVVAERLVREFNAEPTFKGYMGYPSSLCVSVNEEVVHGIPGDKVIKNGDVVSIDFGATYRGFVGDAARTIIVGDDASEEVNQLVQNTKKALLAGIEQMIVGNCLYDIGRAINAVAKDNKYGNLQNFCGHGIGTKMHESPYVFNYINPNEPNFRLVDGLVLALEPMFNLGTRDVEVLEDKWTVVTMDGKPSAHFEVSVAIVDGKPFVLGEPSYL